MIIEEAIAPVSRLLLDTAPLIYALERHPSYIARIETFFRLRQQRPIILVTTPITLAECLIQPIRRNLGELAEKYQHWILNAEDTEFWPIGDEVAGRAAHLRAQYNLSLTDALQAATAIQSGCDAILTNDFGFKRVQEIRAIVLDEIEP